MIKVLNELSDFCFKEVDKKMISLNTYGASWTEHTTDNSVAFRKFSLKKGLRYLLGKCYIKLGNKVFRQTEAVVQRCSVKKLCLEIS